MPIMDAPSVSTSEILDSDELEKVLVALRHGRGSAGFSTEEAVVAVEWAENAKLEGSLFELVMSGRLYLNVQGGQTIFTVFKKG